MSHLDSTWVNEKDNGIVFVETGVPEPGKVGALYSVSVNHSFDLRS